MKTTGIIAEYNPFHNGHLYQLQEVRKSGSDYIIVVLGGDFLQRGTPAIINKYERAKMALLSGADLVIELPVLFACSSAQYFARGAVSILDKLGVVDTLSFGCETDDVSLLKETASFLAEESSYYQDVLQNFLKQGFSFPKARECAVSKLLGSKAASLLSSPNNILALEYCMALSKRNSSIVPSPIRRKDSSYHEMNLIENTLPSATAIRQVLSDKSSITVLKNFVPEHVFSILDKSYEKNYPIFFNDFSSRLHYQLLLCASLGFDSYADITPAISDKIRNHLDSFRNIEQYLELLKSKELTYTRLSRCLLHILLQIPDSMLSFAKSSDYAGYARVLGFRDSALPLLTQIEHHGSIPLITKLSSAKEKLPLQAVPSFDLDILSSHIYESVVSEKYKSDFQNEYRRKLIRLSD